tara:strand:- start:7723 stop:7923 length:201 start_codon:yes stop_codon:yes gene_type:complete
MDSSKFWRVTLMTKTKCYQATYHKDASKIATLIVAEDDEAAAWQALAISHQNSIKLLDVKPDEIFS